MKKLVGLALGSAMALTGSAHAGQIREQTTYFMVKGSTFAELDRQLGSHGPQITHGGERRAGATEVGFQGRVTYKAVGSRCGVDRAAFDLKLHTTLPRWQPPKRADSDTRLLWQTLHDDIVTHEHQHSVIAKRWHKRIESSVAQLPPERDCAAMERTVNALTRQLLNQHSQAQLAFDADEAKRIDKRLQDKVADYRRRLVAGSQ